MELVDQIMSGADLRIFLKPDSKFVKEDNLYCEFLSLPHIIVEGVIFWGHTATNHIRLSEGGVIPFHNDSFKTAALFFTYCKSGFFYSNYRGGMFGELNSEAVDFNAENDMSGFARLDFGYTEHRWVVKNNYVSISGREAVEDAVRNGRKLKVMIEIEKERWATRSPRYYIGEVFLPYLFDSGKTYFLCSPFAYLEASLSRRALDAAQKKYIRIEGVSREQYLIDIDGEYIHLGNAEKWDKGKWQKTKEVRVFAETGDTTAPVASVLKDKPIRFRDRIWKALFPTLSIA